MTEDDRWDKLRNVLTDWRDKDLDPDDLISNISMDEMEGLKDRYSLQVCHYRYVITGMSKYMNKFI